MESGSKCKDSKRADFAESWNKSVEKTEQLIERFDSVTSHPVLNTLSINVTRHASLLLTESFTEITAIIQKDLSHIELGKQQLQTAKTNKI